MLPPARSPPSFGTSTCWIGFARDRPDAQRARRVADLAQYNVKDLDAEPDDGSKVSAANIRSLERVRMRRKRTKERKLVVVPTRATRIRHFARFLEFVGQYHAYQLPTGQCDALLKEVKRGVSAPEEMVPRVSGWAKLLFALSNLWMARRQLMAMQGAVRAKTT